MMVASRRGGNMKRFLLILIVSLLLLSGCNSSNIINKEEKAEIKENNKISEISELNDSEKIIEDESIINEQITEKIDIEEKNQSKYVVEKKIESITEQSQSTAKKEEKKDVPQNNVNNNSEKEKTTSTEIPIWEEYGMTKDEYENTPMGGWRKVTHSSYNECYKLDYNSVSVACTFDQSGGDFGFIIGTNASGYKRDHFISYTFHNETERKAMFDF